MAPQGRVANVLAQERPRPHALMPVPVSVSYGNGYRAIDSTFRTQLVRYGEPRLKRAVTRLVERLSRQTGMYLRMVGGAGPATLEIECEGPAADIQSAIEDESYELVATRAGVRLRSAESVWRVKGHGDRPPVGRAGR